MAQETLKLVITADTAEALQNLKTFIGASKGLKEEMQNFGKVSGSATNALSNLSRVAQDAPYGFIGIANNLNPLLESFQRLKVEAGSSTAALKAMAGGLMGPAGIGLALGAVSSIIVAFGPKIANFIKGVDAAKEAENKFAESLDKARASASESGLKLLAYIGVAEDATIADDKRANALKFVVNELGKVNKAYAATIQTTDQARAAVELYTKALIAQAITSRYVDEIATKTIKLEEANKKAIAAAEEYNKTIERSKTMTNGYVDASVAQAASISRARQEYIDAAQEAVSLNSSIESLNKSLQETVRSAASNPFNNVTNGARELNTEAEKTSRTVEKLGKQARTIKIGMATVVEQPNAATTAVTPTKLPNEVPAWASSQVAESQMAAIARQKEYNTQIALTRDITNTLAPAFDGVISAMVMGEDVGKALENAFKQIVIQLISMIAQALLFKAILGAITGGASEIGGAAGGLGGGMGGLGSILGEFVLKGSDLVLATTRANNNLNIRRGN
jgi:hypothetical protein